jgi:NAD(P)-dependent dehydrogenase (short-subunit alcohol dehydrogenase family)
MANVQSTGKLAGKVALVTGASSGIGRAVAVAMAYEGARVVACYLDEHDDAKETVRLCAKEGQQAIALCGDACSVDFAEDAIRKTLEAFGGGIDILVNNVGGQEALTESIKDISCEQFERTFAKNVYSAFHMTKYALPHMNQNGSIIMTSSSVADTGRGDMLDYAASKGAINAFTVSLAQSPDVLAKGIRVNAVAPGCVQTPLVQHTYSQEKLASFGKDNVLGRCAKPEEIAPSFVFLASQCDSSYITGQVLHAHPHTCAT